jgi:hypothetical protein
VLESRRVVSAEIRFRRGVADPGQHITGQDDTENEAGGHERLPEECMPTEPVAQPRFALRSRLMRERRFGRVAKTLELSGIGQIGKFVQGLSLSCRIVKSVSQKREREGSVGGKTSV